AGHRRARPPASTPHSRTPEHRAGTDVAAETCNRTVVGCADGARAGVRSRSGCFVAAWRIRVVPGWACGWAFTILVNKRHIHKQRACHIGKPLFTQAVARLSVMLARRPELHVRPALFHQAQVHPRRREVGQVPAAVDSQVLMGLVAELLELLLVGTLDPACGPDVDRLVGALDLV